MRGAVLFIPLLGLAMGGVVYFGLPAFAAFILALAGRKVLKRLSSVEPPCEPPAVPGELAVAPSDGPLRPPELAVPSGRPPAARAPLLVRAAFNRHAAFAVCGLCAASVMLRVGSAPVEAPFPTPATDWSAWVGAFAAWYGALLVLGDHWAECLPKEKGGPIAGLARIGGDEVVGLLRIRTRTGGVVPGRHP